jgi:hypothetical protein
MIMSVKVTGLDQLQRQLSQAGEAFKSLDGTVATLRFNTGDPASIDAAHREIDDAIDAKIAPYQGNPLVENVAKTLREKYHAHIEKLVTDAKAQPESP